MPYSPLFRAEAVRLAERSVRPLTQVAADLGIHPSTLRRWMRTCRPAAEATDCEHTAPTAGRRQQAEPAHVVGRDPSQCDITASPSWQHSQIGTAVQARRSLDPAGKTRQPDGARWPSTPAKPLITRGTGYLLVTAALALCVSLSDMISPGPALYRAGVVLHLLSLVTGFGAVIVIDWHGLLWMTGRRSFLDSRRVAEAATPLIWAAITGLLASATVLHPDLASSLTRIKIGAVLLIGLNGVTVSALSRTLSGLPAQQSLRTLPAGLRRRLLTAALTSQLAWWLAIIIGLITDAHRH